jgi:hypothetical protein
MKLLPPFQKLKNESLGCLRNSLSAIILYSVTLHVTSKLLQKNASTLPIQLFNHSVPLWHLSTISNVLKCIASDLHALTQSVRLGLARTIHLKVYTVYMRYL